MSNLEGILVSGGVEGLLEELLRLIRHRDGVGLTEINVRDWSHDNSASVTLRFRFQPDAVGQSEGGGGGVGRR